MNGERHSDSPPAILRVRRPSGRLETFEATELKQDGSVLWATGRWRRRVGLNHSQLRYSPPGTYGFSCEQVIEVRL